MCICERPTCGPLATLHGATGCVMIDCDCPALVLNGIHDISRPVRAGAGPDREGAVITTAALSRLSCTVRRIAREIRQGAVRRAYDTSINSHTASQAR